MPPITYPRAPLKEMDGAMLVFELNREIDRIFADADDREKITSAAMVAAHLHRNQTRMVRGDLPRTPYSEHPLRNTLRLMRWGVTDVDTLVASLLHDTVEDCANEIVMRYDQDSTPDYTKAEMREAALSWIGRQYGHNVSRIVDNVTNPLNNDYLGHVEEMVLKNDTATLLVKAADLVDNAGSLSHQHGRVKPGFVEKRVSKYAQPLELIIATLTASDDNTNDFCPAQRAAHALRSITVQLTTLQNKIDAQTTLQTEADPTTEGPSNER